MYEEGLKDNIREPLPGFYQEKHMLWLAKGRKFVAPPLRIWEVTNSCLRSPGKRGSVCQTIGADAILAHYKL